MEDEVLDQAISHRIGLRRPPLRRKWRPVARRALFVAAAVAVMAEFIVFLL